MMARLETGLRNFTLAFLLVYAPLETWASWGDGLTDPFYLVDFFGMVLLAWGAIHSRRRPQSGAGVMVAGWAWSSANFWRALFGRINALGRGESLDYGFEELCVVACGTAIALVCLSVALVLTSRPVRAQRAAAGGD